jgi:diguanylate cyclase (GGDEF)-like protein/PAS domain S-box-containing protein
MEANRSDGDQRRGVLVDTHDDARQMALILDTMIEGVVVQELDGRIVGWNQAASRLLGLSDDELAGRASTDPRWMATRADDTPWHGETHPAMEVIRTGTPVVGAVMGVRRPRDSRIWLRVTAKPILDSANVLTGVLCTFSDITTEHLLMRSLRRFQYLFENSNDLVLVVDRDGMALDASPSLHRALGTNGNDQDLTATLRRLIHPEDADAFFREFKALGLQSGERNPFTVRVFDYTGEARSLEFVGVNLLDEPSVGGIVLTARDITEREQLNNRLAHQATHDPLTELPNREFFNSELSRTLERSNRDGHRFAICYVDLDRFKDVNDSLGHRGGDDALRRVASVLLNNIRAWDTPARLGGDEFAIILDPVRNVTDARTTAIRLRDRLVALDDVFGVGFGASVGVALNRPADTPETLLQRADEALYLAKSFHSSAVHVAREDIE